MQLAVYRKKSGTREYRQNHQAHRNSLPYLYEAFASLTTKLSRTDMMAVDGDDRKADQKQEDFYQIEQSEIILELVREEPVAEGWWFPGAAEAFGEGENEDKESNESGCGAEDGERGIVEDGIGDVECHDVYPLKSKRIYRNYTMRRRKGVADQNLL